MKLLKVASAASAAGLAAVLCGCVSLFPKATPAQLYRFGQSPAASARTETAGLRPLVLEPVEFPRTATSDGILTVTGDQIAYIAGARWAAPARVLFQEAAQDEFARRTGRTFLANIADGGPQALLVRLSVLKFEADYPAPGAPPAVRIVVDASLSSVSGGPIAARLFTTERRADANRVEAIVRAFDGATDDVLSALGGWVDAEAQAAPAAAGPPSRSSTTTRTDETTTTTSRPPT